jgi:hypothetical protein
MKMDTEARFLQYAKPMEGGCHEWQSTLHRDGYGKFWLGGKTKAAHRVAYGLFVGDPGELCVLHKCDNRKCVNPDHLFLGTDRDNIVDMWNKGRGVGRRKLKREQVERIKTLLIFGRSQQSIADEFGVSQITVSRIKLGQRRYLSFIDESKGIWK